MLPVSLKQATFDPKSTDLPLMYLIRTRFLSKDQTKIVFFYISFLAYHINLLDPGGHLAPSQYSIYAL